MKKITFIKLTYCPFCRKAEKLLLRLMEENEAYRALEIERIAEDLEPERAAAYEYELVPNFWYEDGKVMEGIPYILTLQDLLEGALRDEAAETVGERVRARNFPPTTDQPLPELKPHMI